jgi:hypothetical protein
MTRKRMTETFPRPIILSAEIGFFMRSVVGPPGFGPTEKTGSVSQGTIRRIYGISGGLQKEGLQAFFSRDRCFDGKATKGRMRKRPGSAVDYLS